MKVSVKSGERLFVNGAVLRFSQRTSVQFLNDVHFLTEPNVLQPEEVDCPLAEIYFGVQTLLIDPQARSRGLSHLSAPFQRARDADEDASLLSGVATLIASERFHEAMKTLRPHLSAKQRKAEAVA